jgi:menaquinone-dependent protoporphyrinogen oxidase
MSARVLVLYASTHGQTEKIAQRIAEVLRGRGAAVELERITKQTSELAEPRYDAVVVGASVHAGHHQGEVVSWLKRNRALLAAQPSALFSVSLTAAENTDEAHETTQGYLDELAEQTGWTPTLTQRFAGALKFQEYGVATRVLMRLIERRRDPTADLRGDTEYTDWQAVDAFAVRLADAALPASVG